eukprot:7391011-Prymnesium_polylepis.1
MHTKAKGFAPAAAGKRELAGFVDDKKDIFLVTDKHDDVLKIVSVHQSKGELQLGLGLGPMATLRLPAGQFYAGGAFEGGVIKVEKIYTGVRPGATFRRRGENPEAALASAEWLMHKVVYDEKWYISVGLADGVGGYVGGEGACQAFEASDFFQNFYQPANAGDAMPREPVPVLEARSLWQAGDD